MKFALLLTSTDEEANADQYRRHVAMAQAAERAGFDAIGASQHFLSVPYAYFHPMVLLSKLSSETSLRLFTGVLLMPLLNPVEVAEAAATLDILSEGRFICGVGLGYRPDEFEAFGRSLGDRGRRIDEALEIMRRMWTSAEDGRPIDFDGRYQSLHGVRCTVRPVQPGGPPIWVGGDAEASLERAAKLGDAWYSPPGVPTAVLGEKIARYRKRTVELGRPLPSCIPVRREVYIHADRERAIERAKQVIGDRYEVYRQWRENTDAHSDLRPDVRTGQGALLKASADDPEFRARTVVGNPDDAIAQLRELEEVAEMDVEVVMRLQWPRMDDAEILEMIELIGTDVVPAFAK